MMGSALRPEDYVWSQTARFRRRVDASLEVIRRAAEIGGVGVSYSGGKDSTCVLDLVRRVLPDAPAAHFDSGTELDSTAEMVARVDCEVIVPRMSMLDMARFAGWWGYAEPVDADCSFDAKRVLIDEPSEAFVVRRRLRVLCHGVRAEESGSRSRHVGARGELYQGADRTWYCMPIARWELRDVWAYIASRDLPYNSAYDRMSDARIPREAQRVAGALGERGSGWGRHVYLRRFEPERWHDIVREFPRIALTS